MNFAGDFWWIVGTCLIGKKRRKNSPKNPEQIQFRFWALGPKSTLQGSALDIIFWAAYKGQMSTSY